MMMGSRGLGGKRYQIVAAILTYAAVSMAAVPIAISQHQKTSSPSHAQVQQQPMGDAAQASDAQAGESTDATPQPAPKPRMNLFSALMYLGLIGLASPFLELADPFHGLIGLVILFVGLRIAWKTTAGSAIAQVSGPFNC